MGRNNPQKGSSLKTAITIGNFDGVHRGHRWLLENFKKIADTYDLEPVVLSFFGHPRAFKEALPVKYLLTTPEERTNLIHSLGIKRVEFLKLDKKTMEMTPKEFIEKVLIRKFNMGILFMGFNHHFGRNREGTPQKVATLVKDLNFGLFVEPPYRINGQIVSSTLIREILRKGRVKEAATYLGRHYKICGKVIRGKNMAGKLLGLKTANVGLSPLKLIPQEGTYAVQVKVDDEFYGGALYIGDNPTLKNEFSFEVHIIDFDREIYGKEICVYFVQKVRDDQKFGNLNDLKEAILQDIEKSRDILTKSNLH